MKVGDLVKFPSTEPGPDPVGVVIGFNHFEERAKVYWPDVNIADWEPVKWMEVISAASR